MKMRIIIDSMACCGSSECIKACPEKAIVLQHGKAVLDEAKCDLDGICIPACPQGAISFLEN